MSFGIALLALAGCLAALHAPPTEEQPGENLALHRPYTLDPAPNYPLCSNDPERTLLTDGRFTEGYFWTQKTTVGWQNARPVRITIDLGADLPIRGVSYRTAAGVAGVAWSSSIEVYVSDDGKVWWQVGDLIANRAAPNVPPATGYAVHRFYTDSLKCHGRFVCLQIAPQAAYTFCDEVEVYRGPDELLRARRTGSPVRNLQQDFQVRAASSAVRRAIMADADTIRKQVDGAGLPSETRANLLRELDAAVAETDALRFDPRARAIVPYSAAHARILRVRAAVWRAGGLGIRVWSACAWDPLQPGDLPPKPTARPVIELTMLRNEVRGAVLNLTNAEDQEQVVHVTAQGLPGGKTPPWLTVHEVAWTGTAAGPAVASALLDPVRDHDGWVIRAPSGMTRQIWFSIDSAGLSAGRYRGELILRTAHGPLAAVPIRLRISRVTMPKHLALSLGGWDYTQSPTYGVTEKNLPRVVAFLRKYHVNAPWAQASVMPFGAHDATGRMITPPDTRLMDRWLARWKGARYYFVFVNLSGPAPETPEARRRIADWITFWARHISERGVRPSQLGLLILDEPHKAEQDRTIAQIARVVHEAQPDVLVFEDPIWSNPKLASPEMLAASDILCPNRPMWLANRKTHEAVFLPLQQAGHKLAFYSCSGPVRSLDPYAYHRLQAWDCFRYGMVHEGFWAFGDTGGGSSWNEFSAPSTQYCPEFLDADGPTTSKHMEAIREGLYDHETLTLLKDAVDAAERAGRRGPILEEARRILHEGPRLVTEAQGAANLMWASAKDRTLADKVRVRAITVLERLVR